MNVPKILLIASLAAAGALTAADFWQSKKYTEWSDKEVEKMLKDSPWAKTVQMEAGGGGGGGGKGGGSRMPGMGGGGRGGGGRGGGGGLGGGDGMGGNDPMGMPGAGGGGGGGQSRQVFNVYMRWLSAIPIKQAMARARYGSEAADNPDVQRSLAREETHYVIVLLGVPARFARARPEQVKKNAFLNVKGKEPIAAADVKQDLRETGVNMVLYFPKGENGSGALAVEDGDVELALKLGAANIKQKFKLKNMVVNGKLAL
jgi:hypothetical protein